MEESKKEQENIRDYLRANTELIERIQIIILDDLDILKGRPVEIAEKKKLNEDMNILEQCISQNQNLVAIIKTLEETRKTLIG